MAHDVFISHSKADKAIADAVCHGLEAHGVRCWLASRDIAPGNSWKAAIISAIREARLVVFVFSRAANSSQQVQREVDAAFEAGHPIIPFRIEDVQMNDDLYYCIASRHWLDALTPPIEQHIQDLCRAVGRLLEGADKVRERTAQAGTLAPSSKSERGHEELESVTAMEPDKIVVEANSVEGPTAHQSSSSGIRSPKKQTKVWRTSSVVVIAVASLVALSLASYLLSPRFGSASLSSSTNAASALRPAPPANGSIPQTPPLASDKVAEALSDAGPREQVVAPPRTESTERLNVEQIVKKTSRPAGGEASYQIDSPDTANSPAPSQNSTPPAAPQEQVTAQLDATVSNVFPLTEREVATDTVVQDVSSTSDVWVRGAPRMELEAPSKGGQVKSATDIRVRWMVEDGAKIDPQSVRILYGRLGIDITKRVASTLRVSDRGMEISAMALPSGNHRFKISVTDSRKRTGSLTIEMKIADVPAGASAPTNAPPTQTNRSPVQQASPSAR
jgi:hypothetical protein